MKEIKISEAKTPRSPRGSSGSDIEPLPAAGLALAQFDGVCSMIKDNLFLGSETIARDVAALRRANVTHILNCAGTICPNYHPKVFQYKTLFLSDGKMEDITCLFYDVLEWMEEAYKDPNTKIFVHCQQGVSRSSSFLILYLMWKEQRRFQEVHEMVKSIRKTSNPNAGFMCQLLNWWKYHTTGIVDPILYQVRPHGPGSPDTIVLKEISPKPATRPSAASFLDKRGSFILATSSALYLWRGRDCTPFLFEWGLKYCRRIKHFENLESLPVVEVVQDSEPDSFWVALDTWYPPPDPSSPPSRAVSNLEEHSQTYALLKITAEGRKESLPS